jgi:SAM-dependent methyltransferase
MANFNEVLSEEESWEVSRTRWKNCGPNSHLTWGETPTGDAFIDKANEYGLFGSEKSLLEIGPGYGRLLKSLLSREAPFASYLGLDISPKNVKYLDENFRSDNIRNIVADAETYEFSETFDAVFSSLMLKHLYPTCELVLQNLCGALNPGAKLCFDLIEVSNRASSLWDRRGIGGYVRHYTREEVVEILHRVGLELLGFDEVVHGPQLKYSSRPRLLVVAVKGGTKGDNASGQGAI